MKMRGVITVSSLSILIALCSISGISVTLTEPKEDAFQFWNDVLYQSSTHIFTGSVLSVESQWVETNEVKSIYSFATVSVSESIKGKASGQITLTYEGGEVGNISLTVLYNPWGVIECCVGDKIKAFTVQDETESTTFRLIKIEVISRTEEKTMLRSRSLIPLYEKYRLSFQWTGPLWEGDDTVDWWINEDGTYDIPGTNERQPVINSFNTWENDALSDKDYRYRGTTDRMVELDDYNVVCWIDEYPGLWPARTLFWKVFGAWIEWEIVYNDYYDWGIGDPNRFDVQNVGTHEAGHTLSLDDLYDSSQPPNDDQTMWGYADIGETKKRTLESGDKAGIQYLYPKYPKPTVSIDQPYDMQTVEGNVKIVVSASSASGIDWVKFHAFENVGTYSTGWCSMTYNSGSGKWEAWWDTTETTNDGYHTIVARAMSGQDIFGYDSILVYVLNG